MLSAGCLRQVAPQTPVIQCEPVPLTNPFHLFVALFVAVFAGLLACRPVLAQTAAPAAPAAPAIGVKSASEQLPLWELGVGIAALRLPDYRGAEQAANYALPLPYFVYRGQWLRADREGARAVLLDTQRFEIDVSLAAAAPARNNAAREGMAELPARIEFGPSVNVEFWRDAANHLKLELRAPLRAAYALQRSPRDIGWTFNPHLNLDVRGITGAWDVGLQLGTVFGDRRFHEHLYGVGAADATAARPAFDARGGYAGWLALAGVSRRFDRTWFGAFLRYDSLRGAVVAASPLVKAEQNLTFGVAVSWIFSVSDRLVSVER